MESYAISDFRIRKALTFIDSLRVDSNRNEYYEVKDRSHSEHRVYNQSQYLLTILFKKIGRNNLVEAIRSKHSPDEPDNDLPRRKGRKANDRWCVLEGDIESFWLAGERSSQYNDRIALLILYWFAKQDRNTAETLYQNLSSKYDSAKGVLQMDEADLEKNLYPVYKVALLGIVANKMGDTELVKIVQKHLKRRQQKLGGWRTDRAANLKPRGVANLETTILSTLALLP